ncbi:DNA polymerase III subunit alpha [Candidatus Peregrinibacteria bacterium]|nr:DNA polymerase III subunit alpha [Candidatus Peregrinibacteria bacterium]
MSEKKFVHLHVHSYYSLLDGLSKPEAYVKKAVEQGSPAVALTDHGVMHGCIEFYKACQKHGIKPVIGCEVNIAFNKLTDKRHQIDTKRTHALLLAETQEGYENLLKMTTAAHLEGYYYKPRVDWELMKKHSKGIIALSGCLKGDIPEAVLNEDEEKIKELIERFQSTFGKENFYLEIQDHPALPQQKVVTDKLIELHKSKGIPIVATADCHYVNRGDNEAQDIMLCIQTGRNLDEAGRISMMNSDYSMRPPEEMYQVFSHIPEALENTLKIADRCNVHFEFDKYLIPAFHTPEDKDPARYLTELCFKGLIEKYKLSRSYEYLMTGKAKDLTEEEQVLTDRLNYELKIIKDMGFVGYFLIVWDFVKWAKDQRIVVGPGRGSAAGALVSYTLDITEIDPLKYNLLFERFLNPARISMPDIDLDFADNRRDEVIDYVADKYGRDRVAQICTFGTMAARAAVKDVGRVLGVPFVEMNEFAKLIPERPGTKLKEALEQSPEMREVIEKSDIFKQVMDNALKLEGAVRHVSVHACAVVIADEPLTKYTALQHPPKDEEGIITQYEAKSLESLGLLKMDFLGLKNLTILQTALKVIDRTKGKKINRKEIPINDRKTYALLARGETTGVFQLESAGMKRYLKELKPTEFEDIIAMVSLYRPGPMEWIPDYIKGKHGRKEITYIHASLKPILKTTYGIAIYQEQILQIAQEFAGFSLGEADILRRAIGKKIITELEAQREKFIEGAIIKGHKKDLAIKIFEKVIEPFAGYGFNKSHAACYAMIAYQTAYLKAHYPTEFMTALMSADYGNTDRIVIEIGECEQMGIRVLPPDVNESLSNFTYVEDGKIRFGLSAIKGLGQGSVKMIIEARDEGGKFQSIEDFARRVPAKILNKKTIEALAFSGAMDTLGERKQIGLSFDLIADFGKKSMSTQHTDQAGLFDELGETIADHLKLANVESATASERLKWEKEYLGLYVSSHPLAGLKKYFQRKVIPISQLSDKAVGKPIKVGGIIQSYRKITTKKGDMMAMLTLEDPSGKVDAVMFPKAYRENASTLVEDHLLFAEGILEKRMGEPQIVIQNATPISLEKLQEAAKEEGLWTDDEKIERTARQDAEEEDLAEAEEVLHVEEEEVKELDDEENNTHSIMINRDVDKTFFVKLKTLLEKHPGDQKIQLVIGDKILPAPMTVSFTPELTSEIDELMKASG